MKKSKIIFIRHGESESNVDKNILSWKPDSKIQLTESGKSQAFEAGKILNEKNIVDLNVFCSPHARTRETFQEILKGLSNVHSLKFDHRLREIDIGNSITDFKKIHEDRKRVGKFYYRFPDGESCADVHLRVTQWLSENNIKDGKNYLIISHAATINIFRMIFENLSIDEFENLPKPKNCEMITYDVII